jgi:hypothetical protein
VYGTEIDGRGHGTPMLTAEELAIDIVGADLSGGARIW